MLWMLPTSSAELGCHSVGCPPFQLPLGPEIGMDYVSFAVIVCIVMGNTALHSDTLACHGTRRVEIH
jgi:hypothetical protein